MDDFVIIIYTHRVPSNGRHDIISKVWSRGTFSLQGKKIEDVLGDDDGPIGLETESRSSQLQIASPCHTKSRPDRGMTPILVGDSVVL